MISKEAQNMLREENGIEAAVEYRRTRDYHITMAQVFNFQFPKLITRDVFGIYIIDTYNSRAFIWHPDKS